MLDDPAAVMAADLPAAAIPETTAPAAAAAVAEKPSLELPEDPNTLFLAGLFLLALLAACYVASNVVLPLVLAMVLQLLLQPAIRVLRGFGVPRMAAALMVMVLPVVFVLGLVSLLSGPAASWAGKLPDAVPRLEERLSAQRAQLDVARHALARVESLGEEQPVGQTVAVQQSPHLADALFTGTRALATGLFTTFVLPFSLLAYGDTFLRRFVEILPRFRDKRQVVDISQQIDRDISAYLLTITGMNLAVGTATGLVMWLSGIGDPLLWGAAAFLLNYLPLLGPLTGTALFLFVGFLSFDTLWRTLLPALLCFAIHIVEGEVVTPLLVARRFTLNPVLVVLAIVFWYWLWVSSGRSSRYPSWPSSRSSAIASARSWRSATSSAPDRPERRRPNAAIAAAASSPGRGMGR